MAYLFFTFFLVGPKTWFGIFPIIIIPTLALLVGGLLLLAFQLLAKIPKPLVWVLPSAYFLISFAFRQGPLSWQFPILLIICAGGAGAALYTFTKSTRSQNSLTQKVIATIGGTIGIAGLVWGLIWAFNTGFKPNPELINANLEATYRPELIDAPNPAISGDYEVGYLTYGSGKDKHRPEFAEDVTIQTDAVDGSRLIDNWEGISGKLRTWYWGFDDEALPINGRVWYPKGKGKFPLALIVHGNHSMFDYSDLGYEYLGKLLASHGIIMVSVDENFINSGWTDILSNGLDEENDARGWLLLKHLQEWRAWNKDESNPFFEKADMENIAVMGHSRGGEAAAIAGFFNTLKYYPDDAKESFDFNFNIKAVVSIAPVDGQYKPSNIGTPLNDVNYLVLHGSNDGDVQSFAGLRQYERIEFSDSTDFFKSAVYIYGANHGQFNTSWGNKDSPQPFASLLNLDALMPMENQLTIAKTFINGFLQITLKGKSAYRELFKDYRSGLDWLPTTIYLNQFQDSNWRVIADFDDDLDLLTTNGNAKISSENLTVWQEKLVGMKWGNKGTRGVYIGWDSTAHPIDTAKYAFKFRQPINLEEFNVLSFEIAQSTANTYPDRKRDRAKREKEEKEKNKGETSEKNEEIEEEEIRKDDKKNKKNKEKKAPDPINFSIRITDLHSSSFTFTLDKYALLQPQINVDIYKNKSLQTNSRSEAVYQTMFFDWGKLVSDHFELDKSAISKIELVFDQTKRGVIILDKVSIHKQY